MKKCPFCAEEIQDEAIVCKHCKRDLQPAQVQQAQQAQQAKKKGTSLASIFILLGVIVVLGVVCMFKAGGKNGGRNSGSSGIGRAQKIQNALSYLQHANGVEWFDVHSNTVYIGFKTYEKPRLNRGLQSHFGSRGVIEKAALACEKAIDFGCHVWAVRADSKATAPMSRPFFDNVTARYGKIQD